MPTVFNKFTNDIVSLAVLILMVVAFVAGQGVATAPAAHSTATDTSPASEQVIAVEQDAKRRSSGG